jgi:hypothetical protein
MTRARTPQVIVSLAALACAVAGPVGCARGPGAAPPAGVRRVAVLPPCDGTGAPLDTAPPAGGYSPDRAQQLSTVLVDAAASQLTSQGYKVLDPALVAALTGGAVPSSPERAGDIAAAARLDATAMFLRLRQWEPDFPTMRTAAVIVAIDVMLVDPPTRAILWQVRRSPRPVPIYGALFRGQAYVVAAQELMKEVLAPLRPTQSPPT